MIAATEIETSPSVVEVAVRQQQAVAAVGIGTGEERGVVATA